MIWLGDRAGYLSDWVTQRWVQATGRKVRREDHSWLDGPIGNTRAIGADFFRDYAEQHNYELIESGPRGLLPDFRCLSGASIDPCAVAPSVRDFYERTSEYELDAWSEWHGLFQPFGTALSILFSKRLQQLNVPLSSLDSSRGMSSNVLQLRDRESHQVMQTAWVRKLHATRNVIYAGSYSVCPLPGDHGPCVKVVFPLPNGNAIVLMKPQSHPDGSLSLTSSGREFGDPGFYFTVESTKGMIWARYIRAMQERITVYPAEQENVRADHVLRLWGRPFLRLHYRMRIAPDAALSGQPVDAQAIPRATLELKLADNPIDLSTGT